MPDRRVLLTLRDGEFDDRMDGRFLRAIAIVRVDLRPAPISAENADVLVKVQKVLFNIQDARKEAERLNQDNGDKGCWYFTQVTRIRVPDTDDAAGIPHI